MYDFDFDVEGRFRREGVLFPLKIIEKNACTHTHTYTKYIHMDPIPVVIVNNHDHHKLALHEREKAFRKVFNYKKYIFLWF